MLISKYFNIKLTLLFGLVLRRNIGRNAKQILHFMFKEPFQIDYVFSEQDSFDANLNLVQVD